MLEFVDATIGTLNERRFSNGNIYPVTAVPFGMAHFTVQTDGSAGSWFYSPISHAFEGFRLTHQPSPWVGDYGHLLLLPFSGKLYDEGARWSSIRPEDAVVRPDMLQYDLQRYGVRASLAPTVRGCVIRIENRAGGDTALAFIPYVPSSFKAEGNALSGDTDGQSYWGFKRIREYIYAEYSKTPSEVIPLENGGVALRFSANAVEISLATGFVSPEQTRRNFELELRGKSFSEVAAAARGEWEEMLGKIAVSDEDPKRKRTFYSCLYRTMLYPRVFHECSEAGPVHYNADTARVEKGVFYTDNGFWDTYRTVYPLLSLLVPERVKEMVEGFLNYSEETGWLPKWLSPGEIGLMPGTLVEAVIADAAVKGLLTKEQLERAYRAMLRNAYEKGNDRHGRTGVEDYMRYGYVPSDVKESVNHTLDSAYGDFCISRVAALLHETEQENALLQRSKCYRNLFDPASRFFRGKDREGNFRTTFDPFEWGGDNCEGSSWQNSFNVCFDLDGLARLHGGRENLLSRLDELFAAPPVYRVGRYEQEIHEMSEMACADFGQCAISNQPSFHIPWLYAALGEREKTERWVEKLASEAFSSEIDGFPGDEDNGTMAAWYIFACLGFYPLCPAKPEYIASKPLFARITLCGKEIGRAETQFLTYAELMQR